MKTSADESNPYEPPSMQDAVSTEFLRPNVWARVLGYICLLLSVVAVIMYFVFASILIPQAVRLEASIDSMVVDLPTNLRQIESERDQSIIFASWVLGSVCIVLAITTSLASVLCFRHRYIYAWVLLLLGFVVFAVLAIVLAPT